MDALGASQAREHLLATLALLPQARGTERPILLAVSGGPDSLALLLLAAESAPALRDAGFSVLVATVDHGLRPESAAEAADVGRLCDDLRLPHRTLGWNGNKPAANLAAAARDARYRLLAGHAERTGAAAILTAHHQDDQIETHQLALARRAGDRGLAGMRRIRALSPGVFLLRPFLCVPGAALKAAVAERGIRAVEDPSNRDPRFARATLRAAPAMPATERRAVLARIAAHAAARDAEDAALAEWIANARETGRLALDGRGVVRFDAEAFHAAAPRTIATFLARALRAAGGAAYPPPHAAAEALGARMRASGFRGATLGGAVVAQTNGSFAIFREYGRHGLLPVALSANSVPVFDRRFRVSGRSPGATGSLVAFGIEGRGGAVDRTLPVLLSEAGDLVAAHPALAARRLPRAARLGLEGLVGFRLFADLP